MSLHSYATMIEQQHHTVSRSTGEYSLLSQRGTTLLQVPGYPMLKTQLKMFNKVFAKDTIELNRHVINAREVHAAQEHVDTVLRSTTNSAIDMIFLTPALGKANVAQIVGANYEGYTAVPQDIIDTVMSKGGQYSIAKCIYSKADKKVVFFTNYTTNEYWKEWVFATGLFYREMRDQFSTTNEEHDKLLEVLGSWMRGYGPNVMEELNTLRPDYWNALYKEVRERVLFEELNKQLVSSVEVEISDRNNQINSCYSDIEALEEAKRLLLLKLASYKQGAIADKLKELQVYTKMSPYVTDMDLNGSKIKLYLKVPLIFHDKMEYEAMIAGTLTGINMDHTRKQYYRDVLDDTFMNDKYKIYITEKFQIDVSTLSWQRLTRSGEAVRQNIVNPHLQYYGCYGNNRQPINKAVNNFDLPAAISQIVATVGHINWRDGAIAPRFIKELVLKSDNVVLHSDSEPITLRGEVRKRERKANELQRTEDNNEEQSVQENDSTSETQQ